MTGSEAAPKPIRLSAHALGYVIIRGFTADEVEGAIRTSEWRAAELNKLECSKEFGFDGFWHGRPYTIKTVRPIFVDEPEEIVVVTVYTYYS